MAEGTAGIQWRESKQDKDINVPHHFYSVLLLHKLFRLRFFTLLQRLLIVSLLLAHQGLKMLYGLVLLL